MTKQKDRKIFTVNELRNRIGLRYLNTTLLKKVFDEMSLFSGQPSDMLCD